MSDKIERIDEMARRLKSAVENKKKVEFILMATTDDNEKTGIHINVDMSGKNLMMVFARFVTIYPEAGVMFNAKFLQFAHDTGGVLFKDEDKEEE